MTKLNYYRMTKKLFIGYCALLILSFFLHATKLANSIYNSSIPVLMFLFPIIVGYKVSVRFSIKDITIGLVVSLIILLPYYLLFGGNTREFSISYMVFVLLGISLPEEFFFRGFLQDSMGRTTKAVLFVSFLFAFAHLPKAIFFNEWTSLLSFFPSLVMGWLYMKTNNIIPGTFFHWLANMVYQSGMN